MQEDHESFQNNNILAEEEQIVYTSNALPLPGNKYQRTVGVLQRGGGVPEQYDRLLGEGRLIQSGL